MDITKQRAIELHLINEGTITSWEAIERYGDTRLAATIKVLRNRDWDIETEMIPFVDRFGKKKRCAKYHLKRVGQES